MSMILRVCPVALDPHLQRSRGFVIFASDQRAVVLVSCAQVLVSFSEAEMLMI
jgi:hypothetical protein